MTHTNSLQPQGLTCLQHPSAQPPKRLQKRYLAAALVLLSSTLGHAQSTTPYQSPATDIGWRTPGSNYISINVGTSDLARPITGAGVFGSSAQGRSYSLSSGHYFPGENYGFELGYTDFGSTDRNNGKTKVDGINLSLIGRMPISSNFNLLGKIGTTYGRTTVDASQASGAATGTEQGFDWSYGVGAEVVFNPEWSAVLQYDEHFVKYVASSNERVSATTLGLRYRF
jgi:OOP family OmpA-OmpF porin